MAGKSRTGARRERIGGLEAVVLSHGPLEAWVVPSHGSNLARFTVGGRAVIAILNLRFESGVLGRVGLFLGPILPFTFRLRLYGTRGSLENNKLWLDSIPEFAETGREEDCLRLPKSWVWDNVQGGISETWKASIDAFIDDVRLDRHPDSDEVSGFNTAAVCFAAVQSAAEGRSVRPERL